MIMPQPKIPNPQSWPDLEACGCDACLAIVELRDRCHDAQEFLFVCDGRECRDCCEFE